MPGWHQKFVQEKSELWYFAFAVLNPHEPYGQHPKLAFWLEEDYDSPWVEGFGYHMKFSKCAIFAGV